MDLDLNSRSSKWKQEQASRKSAAKKRIQDERKKREAVAKARREREAIASKRRQEELAAAAAREALELEEQRITGGIKYCASLRPVPTTSDGDRLTLPPSALEELNPQEAFDLGAITLELTDPSKPEQKTIPVLENDEDMEEETQPSVGHVLGKTHAGVREFTAEEGTVGIPPKVAVSLLHQLSVSELPASIQVKFVRLGKGQFAALRPLGSGFGDRQLDHETLLSRALHPHATLTQGDIVLVRHGGVSFEVQVSEVKPRAAVQVINTDLEVDVLPSEQIQAEMDAKQRAEEAKQLEEAKARAKEERRRQLYQELPPEPEAGDPIQIMFRFPDGQQATRKFDKTSQVSLIFSFVESVTGEAPSTFQLVTRFPRQVYTFDASEKSLKEVGLSSSREALLMESIASVAAETSIEKAPDVSDHSIIRSLEEDWKVALENLEKSQDEALQSDANASVHGLEPSRPTPNASNEREKWAAQLEELQAMGFSDVTLNIQLLERYRGRLLRVVNYLSDMEPSKEPEAATASE